MRVTKTNDQLAQMLTVLERFLDKDGMLGYAIARNIRRIREVTTEYFQIRDELVIKHGKPDVDDDGRNLGTTSLSPLSPEFAEFVEELSPYAQIEEEVELFTVPYKEVIGLTASEILELEFMLEE